MSGYKNSWIAMGLLPEYRFLKSSLSSILATVYFEASIIRSDTDRLFIQLLLNTTSVFFSSSILDIWALYVSAFLATSSFVSGFLDKNRMPQMEVRGGGIKTCLYTKRPSCFKALFKFSQKLFFRDEFCCPSFDDGKLRCNIHHNATFTLSIASALPDFDAMDTKTPCSTISFVATSNFLGICVRNRSSTISFCIPITEFMEPVMPASVMNAVPRGRTAFITDKA